MVRRLLLVLVLALAAQLPAPVAADTEQQEWDLVARLNALRYEHGLRPLVVHSDVRRVARDWSAHMAATGRLAHNPNVFAQVLSAIPSRRAVGENVGRARDAARLHDLWAASAGHRANMLGDYHYVGVGLAGQAWGTQVFVRASETVRGITRVPLRRLKGSDAIRTALVVSRSEIEAGRAGAVVVARADVFADALVGGPLAGAEGGPVLLSPPDAVPPEVVEEARRALAPHGVVYLMGGPSALAPGVEAAFLAAGLRTQRVAGRDRFDTAAQAAVLLNPQPAQVLVASGETFADALSAGVPAAVHRMPIVLTLRDSLPAVTEAYLAAHPRAVRTVVGGPAAVTDAVVRRADASARVAGSNRFATSVRIAQTWFPDATGVWVATGERHEDALIGVPGAARLGQPLLLLASGPERTLYDYSRTRIAALEQATAVGGSSGVPEPVLSLLFN